MSQQRLSLNQATVKSWDLRQTVEACARHDIPYVGLWRDRLAETGTKEARRLLEEAGVQVSSLCRGGFFTAPTPRQRSERLDDNRRAIDEAADVGTDVLVLVCGGVVDKDLEGSRQMVADSIAELAPFAAQRGVRLGIEPLHPMFAGDRSVICSLSQALAVAEPLSADGVGVIVDVYHVWWDEKVHELIDRAGERIIGFHVNDWLAPPPDVLLGRGMMGDGVIDLAPFLASIESAGYSGPIEVEIFNAETWNTPGDEVLRTVCERYGQHVVPGL